MSSRRWVGLVALVVAIAIWVWWLLATAGPASVGAPLTVLLVLAVGIDIVVAVGIVRGRVNRASFAWLVLRLLASIASLLFLTVIPYAITMIALAAPAFPDAPVGDPSKPHRFRPPTGGFLRPLTNIGWSQESAGMVRHTQEACAVCGRLDADLIHAPAD